MVSSFWEKSKPISFCVLTSCIRIVSTTKECRCLEKARILRKKAPSCDLIVRRGLDTLTKAERPEKRLRVHDVRVTTSVPFGAIRCEPVPKRVFR